MKLKDKTANKKEITQTYFSDDSTANDTNKSLNGVKNDVLNVIELMGPETPHFKISSSSVTELDSSAEYNNQKNTDDSYTSDYTLQSVVSMVEDSVLSVMAEKASSESTEKLISDRRHVCAPPPEHIYIPTQCLCNEMIGYMEQQTVPIDRKYDHKKNIIQNWFKSHNFGKYSPYFKNHNTEYYKINIPQTKSKEYPPKRLVFDLVDNIPNSKQINYVTETHPEYDKLENNNKKDVCCERNNEANDENDSSIQIECCGIKPTKKSKYFEKNDTRVDIYYFDHGNSTFLRTTDRPPLVITEIVAEKTDYYTTKFWAEIFGSCHIGFAFCTAFILQLFRFILCAILRPLTVGIVQLASDYFFKPCLATLFNAVIQPPLLFLYNVATSLRDLCDPLAEAVGYFLREVAVVFRSCRLLDVKLDNKRCSCDTAPKCSNKKKEEDKV